MIFIKDLFRKINNADSFDDIRNYIDSFSEHSSQYNNIKYHINAFNHIINIHTYDQILIGDKIDKVMIRIATENIIISILDENDNRYFIGYRIHINEHHKNILYELKDKLNKWEINSIIVDLLNDTLPPIPIKSARTFLF